jgi:VWFA-related protein
MATASRAAAVLSLCALLVQAQTPLPEVSIRTNSYSPPSLVLHAETNLVETGLTVRDPHGHTVGGLHASDFEILDNGVPQPITGFSEVRSSSLPAAPTPTVPVSGQPADAVPPARTDPLEPRYITFFFDDVHTFDLYVAGWLRVPAGSAFFKQAAHAFIDSGLAPADWLSIVTASGEGDLDFTNDRKLFAEKFDGLRSHAYATSAAAYQTQTLNMIAALKFAAKRLSEKRGTRVLLVISHGYNNRLGLSELEDFIDTALRWNITVQAIYARGLDITPSELSPPEIIAWDNRRFFFGLPMQEMAERTGGHFFKDTDGFADAMEQAVNPEVTYLVAFRPGAADGKLHTLKIRFASKRNDSLEFRQSYFSRKGDDSEKKLAARAPMDDAVFSNRTLQEIPAAVTLAGGPPKDGMIPVSIGITVDVNRLQFTSSHGRHMQQLAFLMALLDAKGDFVTGKESIMDLALTDEKLAAVKKDGLKTVATLHAPPGIYQVRTVVREGAKGSLAASTTAVELQAK